MSKITINLSLKSKDENYCNKKIKGILNNNELVFNDGNIITTVTIGEILKIKRKCSEYTLCFDLNSKKDTLCAYYINGLNMNLKIKTLKIINKNNYIYAKYKMEDSIIELEIGYEVI